MVGGPLCYESLSVDLKYLDHRQHTLVTQLIVSATVSQRTKRWNELPRFAAIFDRGYFPTFSAAARPRFERVHQRELIAPHS
jgi:hypothetical protein